ncbi:MAG TPA: hypothetical protein VLA04_01395 [Verrucomicrobiae bacterium]|nr:hypothetical protein [Verrucomicrobiae bacterium]
MNYYLENGWYLYRGSAHLVLDPTRTSLEIFTETCHWLLGNWPGNPVATLLLPEGLKQVSGRHEDATHGQVLAITYARAEWQEYARVASDLGFDRPYLQILHQQLEGEKMDKRVWFMLNLGAGVSLNRADGPARTEGQLMTAR